MNLKYYEHLFRVIYYQSKHVEMHAGRTKAVRKGDRADAAADHGGPAPVERKR